MVSRFSYGVLAALCAAWLVVPGTAGAQNYRQLGIYPVFDGWETLPDGSLEFYFGYMNRHTTAVTIPVGPDNAFDPGPGDQNQPTNFLPGRHEHVFTIRKPKGFDGKFTWTVKSGVGAQKAIASPNQLYILEVEEEDPGEHAIPPKIAGVDASGKVGQPIALSTKVTATAQKERVIEGSAGRGGSGVSVAWSLYRGAASVTFANAPGATPPRAAPAGRGRPQPVIPGVFTTNCAFPITESCGAVQATFTAPGEYVLRAEARQQREQARTFVRVKVEP